MAEQENKAKIKANELFNKVCKSQNSLPERKYATDVRTAILIVDEILDLISDVLVFAERKFWQEVKAELEKM